MRDPAKWLVIGEKEGFKPMTSRCGETQVDRYRRILENHGYTTRALGFETAEDAIAERKRLHR